MKVELETGEIGDVEKDYLPFCEVGSNAVIIASKPDGFVYSVKGVVKYIYLKDGKIYLTKSRGKVRVKKANNFNGFYYKYTVDQWLDTDDTNTSEVWSSRGEAIHYDCGYNIIKEVI